MRVGLVTTWFERGAGMVSRQIADALSSAGMDVRVYARGEKYAIGNPKWDLPNVHWGRRLHWPGSGKIDRADFEAWISSNKIEIIIFNEQRWWQPILWAKAAGVRCGSYVDYYTRETVPLFGVYDFLICNTRRHYSVFEWHPGAVYLPWGTDTEVFKPAEKPPQRLTFFHSCGWDTYRKGTDLVIKAFESIQSQTKAELIIHSQRNLSDSISSGVGVTVRVETVPAPGLYHLGDFYVYPSRLEGIGLTICEALSSGLPVITTDEGPMSEFVRHEKTGFLVPVARRFARQDGYYWPMCEIDVQALADAMLRASEMDLDSIRSMQRAARVDAVKSRSWNDNSSALVNIVTAATSIALSPDLVQEIRRYDYAGVKGKIDYLIDTPILGALFAEGTAAYRRLRQPHLYRDHA